MCLDWESRKLRPRRQTASNCSYGCASSSNSTNFCVIPTRMPHSPELGISCPPFQEYPINFLLFTSPSVNATKCLQGSLSPRTNRVGILIGVPQSETSSLFRQLAQLRFKSIATHLSNMDHRWIAFRIKFLFPWIQKLELFSTAQNKHLQESIESPRSILWTWGSDAGLDCSQIPNEPQRHR